MPRTVKEVRRAVESAARIETRTVKTVRTVRKLSRQREYQIRHDKKGLCAKCPKKAVHWGLCRKHERKQVGYQIQAKARKLAAFGKLK